MTSGVQWDVGLTDQGNCAEMMLNQNVKTPSFALHLWSEQICQDDELSCICGAECPCVFSEAHACKREKSVCFSRYEYCDFQQYQVKSADFVFCAVSEGESEMSQMFLRRLRSRYCTCVCVCVGCKSGLLSCGSDQSHLCKTAACFAFVPYNVSQFQSLLSMLS